MLGNRVVEAVDLHRNAKSRLSERRNDLSINVLELLGMAITA